MSEAHAVSEIHARLRKYLIGAAAVMLGVAAAQGYAAESKAVDDLINQADAAQRAGKPKDAIAALSRAIEQDPGNADLYARRERAYDSTGDLNKAVADANKYIELKPNDPEGYLNRARSYRADEKNDESLADINKAISLAPTEPDGYYRRADLYSDMGKKDLAKADEAKAAELEKQAR